MKQILVIGTGEKVNESIRNIQAIEKDATVRVVENIDDIDKDKLKEFDIILDNHSIPKGLKEEMFLIKDYGRDFDYEFTPKNKPKGHQRPYKYHR